MTPAHKIVGQHWYSCPAGSSAKHKPWDHRAVSAKLTFGSSYVTSGKESSGTPACLQNGLSIQIVVASLFLVEKFRDDLDAHQ